MTTRCRITLTIAALALCAAGNCSAETTLLASYSLDNTTVDATGQYGDIELINAPFEDGGVYVNGIYLGEGYSSVTTPDIASLTTNSFTISVEFKVQEFPSLNPVIIGSAAWRWIGAMIDWNEKLQLIYNSTRTNTSDTLVTLDEWHLLVVTYDGVTGNLYMDGQAVVSKEFTIQDGDDRRIGATHGGNGVTFKGHLRNLEIFNGIPADVAVPTSSFGAVKSHYGQ